MFLPETSPMTPNPLQSIRDALKAKLRDFTEDPQDKTYDELAVDLDVSKGALWKFIHTDYVPTSSVIRRKFGIPEPEYISQYRNPLGQFERR